MMQFQARPTSEKENVQVQTALFAFGYGWRGVGFAPNVVQKSCPIILAKKDGTLIRGSDSLSLVEDYPIANCQKIIAEHMKRIDTENTRPVHGEPLSEDEAVAKIAETIGVTPDELLTLGKKAERVEPNPDELPSGNGLLNAAVRTLERKGYTYHGGEEWKPPLGVGEEPFKCFWMVMNPKGTIPKKKHYRPEEAQAEAIRIARMVAEDTIYVLQVVAAYTGKVDVKRALPDYSSMENDNVSDRRN